MAWDFKDIKIEDIPISDRSTLRYKELYDRIFSLRVGEAFEVKTSEAKDADNIRKSVVKKLRDKKVESKYVATKRGNVFYCGRVK